MKFGYIGYIPANVRYDKNLSPRDKLIFCEITATLDENGVCTKNNIHFSKVFDVAKNTISASITNLRKHGYIHVQIEKDEKTQKFIKRYITMTGVLGGYPSIQGGGSEPTAEPYTSIQGGVSAKNGNTDHSEQGGYTSDGDATIINNSISYKYSDKRHHVKMYDMNKKQKSFLWDICEKFYNHKRQLFPEVIKEDWESDTNLIVGSMNNLFDLIRKDGWGETIVRDVIIWSLDDPFWSKNTLSLRSLRNKSKNGESKFTNMYTKYKG